MDNRDVRRLSLEIEALLKYISPHISFNLFKQVCESTVKPVLSGHRIRRTPSIKRTVAEGPKFISLIYFY